MKESEIKMELIVGGIIEKDGKVLLVQESKPKCYGKWNIPAGHLEPNETIMEGAIREIKEETGCDVCITGVLSIENLLYDSNTLICIIFSTKLLSEYQPYKSDEILDTKWFEIDDIINNMDDKLRDVDIIKHPIINYKNGNIYNLDIINDVHE